MDYIDRQSGKRFKTLSGLELYQDIGDVMHIVLQREGEGFLVQMGSFETAIGKVIDKPTLEKLAIKIQVMLIDNDHEKIVIPI